jgi:hypothetical protein
MTPYGKDPAQLTKIDSFRQRTGQFSMQRARPAARGGVPYFIDQYIPPLIDSDTIALLDGGYEHTVVDNSGDEPKVVPVLFEFVQFREHFDGTTRKSAICSAGPFVNYRDLRNACNGCDIYWATLEPDAEGKKRSTRMSRQDKYAFSMIDFSDYHKTPQFDASGKPKVNQKTNQQYFNWQKCEGRGCQGCKHKYETKFGHNPHWPMPHSYLKFLREKDRQIAASCRSCGGLNTIQSIAYLCQGCGIDAINMKTTNLTSEDIRNVTEKYYTCTSTDGGARCGHTGFLKELVECSACSHGEGMSIFDVEFKVLRIPTEGNKSILDVSNWVRRRPLTGDLAELEKPKDLLKLFGPTPNKVQLERFGPPPVDENKGRQQPQQQQQGAVDESRPYGDQYR